jgi:glutamine cyclotransferase
MKYKVPAGIALVAIIFAACKHPSTDTTSLSISPEAGTRYKLGDQLSVKVTLPSGTGADSIQYLVDSVRITSRKDTATAKLKTDSLKLGSKLITARIFSGGKPQEVSTNILLLAAKAPEIDTFVVEKVYPHDTTSYTEGLQYVDGYLYESTGVEGQSRLLKTELATGKILESNKMDAKYFGEGIAVVGDKIFQLTYRPVVLNGPIPGFIYDKKTLKQIGTFNYTWGKEGWGMCFDGKTVYNNDSTNRIFMLNKDTMQPFSYIDVYDDKHDIQRVNEMEFIDGNIYSNIYTTDSIIVINPKNGAVLKAIDLAKLYPVSQRPRSIGADPGNNVLNGIAWDEKGKRLFITGKKWDKMFQVKFVKKGPL